MIRQATTSPSNSFNESLALEILQSRNSSKSEQTVTSVDATTLEADEEHSFAEDQSEADVEATKSAATEQDPNLVNEGSCQSNHRKVLTSFFTGYL